MIFLSWVFYQIVIAELGKSIKKHHMVARHWWFQILMQPIVINPLKTWSNFLELIWIMQQGFQLVSVYLKWRKYFWGFKNFGSFISRFSWLVLGIPIFKSFVVINWNLKMLFLSDAWSFLNGLRSDQLRNIRCSDSELPRIILREDSE